MKKSTENEEKKLTISDNRKKVLSWLEGLTDDDWRMYHSDSEVQNIAKAAFELLKDQEPVEPTFIQDKDGIFTWACGSCGAYMYHIYEGIDKAKEYAKFCRKCGRSVKWND